MKISSFVLPVLVSIGACLAGPTSPGPNTYVRVLYTDGTLHYFDYGECYPYTINGADAAWAVWLKSTTCYEYSNDQCTGAITPPVGVPLPAGATLINVADFVHLIGGGAICYANSLPGIPIVSLEQALQDGFGGGAKLLASIL